MAAWLVAAIVILGLAYIAWEFRWYWSTMIGSWRGDVETAEEESNRQLAGSSRTR